VACLIQGLPVQDTYLQPPLLCTACRIVSYAVRRHKPGGATGAVSCHAGALDPALWGAQDWEDNLLSAAAARTSHEGRLQVAAAEAEQTGSVGGDSSSSQNDEAVLSLRLLEGALDRLGKQLRGLEGLALKVRVEVGGRLHRKWRRGWLLVSISLLVYHNVQDQMNLTLRLSVAAGCCLCQLQDCIDAEADWWHGAAFYGLLAGGGCAAPVSRLTRHRSLPSPPSSPGRCRCPGAAAAAALSVSGGGQQG
jgi:hypothetical protein